MKTHPTPKPEAVDQPRLVRVFEFELWNQNGGKIGTIRGIAPTMKEARAIVKLVPHGWIVRNGKRLKDCLV